jgi:hypothetical protein
MSPLGHSRRFRDVPDESGLLPTPDALRHRSEPMLKANRGQLNLPEMRGIDVNSFTSRADGNVPIAAFQKAAVVKWRS